jgi:hypothetical protein
MRDVKIRSVGRARGGGRSSKAKGRTAVVIVAEAIRARFGLAPGDVFVKATSQVGCDIHLSPLALAKFPYSIEVKNCEKINIWQALAQAAANSTDELPPILFFKRAHTELYVALRASDFLEPPCTMCERCEANG